MTTRAPAPERDVALAFEEFRTEAGSVVRIADPSNEDAWLLADCSVPIEA